MLHHPTPPQVLLLNAGAWNAYNPHVFNEEASPRDVAAATEQAARWLQASASAGASPSPFGVVWATTLGLRTRNTRFSEEVAARLLSRKPPPRDGWRVLNRTSVLARLASPGGWTGVRMSSKHAPHAVNYVDAQRLLRMILLRPRGGGEGTTTGTRRGVVDECEEETTKQLCAPSGAHARVSRVCLGLDLPNTGSFIEAWQQYCAVDFVEM